MSITKKLDKLVDDYAPASIKLPFAVIIAMGALPLGINLAKERWKPTRSEISEYVQQGIQLTHKIYKVQGSNEVLNPLYIAQNSQ